MARTIFEQTGFRRAHPEQLLQDTDFLMRVNEFDYSLEDRDFRQYLSDRGVVTYENFDSDDLSLDQKCPIEELISHPLLQFSTSGLKFSDDDKRSFVKISKLERASIQDAWELYRFSGQREAEYNA